MSGRGAHWRSFRGFKLGQRELICSGRADTSRLTCRASRGSNGAAPLCGEPATWMLTAACVHEHVVPSLACDAHADDARSRQKNRGIACTPCAKDPALPHHCLVVIEFAAIGSGASRDDLHL